jgi:pyruvate kinase
LGRLGLSRLGRAESHVLASITALLNVLKKCIGKRSANRSTPAVNISQGERLIQTHTTALLGKKLKGSPVRIMVTLPSDAVQDKKLISNMINAGMNSARINCAHDDPDVWEKMIDAINKAKKKSGRNCKICMDLGGPKLRTGTMKPGPKLVHLQPERDSLGKIIAASEIWLTAFEKPTPPDERICLPVPAGWLKKLKKGDRIVFKDTRGKKCILHIGRKESKGRWAKCYSSAYIVTGTKMTVLRNKKKNNLIAKAGEVLPLEQKIFLRIGDTLLLHKNPLPQVFADVKTGEPILMDDGKIEGVIKSVSDNELEVEITYAKEEGSKLRGDKGINLPQSNLKLSGLTEKDKKDLPFIIKHADVINFSFVNDPQDVHDLLAELKKLNRQDIGIILKIETQKGFRNLPAILLAAMQTHPVGVMIARGDLAIEGGWKHLAQIQEEIMWLCEAAHIPIVWATQVLETLAKKGRPSRAEITDAAMAQRAECVMLNKGPHIVATIKMLDEIMQSMGEYHQKQAPMIPKLETGGMLSIS